MATNRLDREKRAAAFHEAGHVLMDLEYGIEFRYVRIYYDKDVKGYGGEVQLMDEDWLSKIPKELTPETTELLKQRLVALLAGRFAQEFAQDGEDIEIVEIENDLKTEEEILRRFPEEDRADVCREVADETRELLNDPVTREKIDKLADELGRADENREVKLTWEQVQDLLRGIG